METHRDRNNRESLCVSVFIVSAVETGGTATLRLVSEDVSLTVVHHDVLGTKVVAKLPRIWRF